MFFFSSRRRHTRFDCDWSSDVCSSDLGPHVIHLGNTSTATRWGVNGVILLGMIVALWLGRSIFIPLVLSLLLAAMLYRSEERRVGKECRSRWSLCHEKKKV